MATFKVKLETRRPKQDNTCPVIIRIFNGDKYRDISLGFSVLKSEFIEKKGKALVKACHPNAANLNLIIHKKLNEVRDTALKLQMNEEAFTAPAIVSSVVKPRAKLSFIQYGWQKVEELKSSNHYGNSCIYRDALNALTSHSGKSNLLFKEVDYQFLSQFENKMLFKGIRVNTIAVYLRTLRAIYNRAIKEKQVEKSYYPFDDFKIKSEPTAKRNISKEDIAAIAKAELPVESQQWHARNYFILSFNLRGISFADMVTIRPGDITNGRLVYKRKKTHKLYTIKLTGKAAEILNYYQRPDRTYILPVIPEQAVNNPVEERKYIQYGTKTTNRHLRHIAEGLKIQQAISTYYSRHSWATIAKRIGYSKDMISEALGHSQGNRITEVYLDSYDQDVIDQMNEQVCKF